MKYFKLEFDINAKRDLVVELFMAPEHMSERLENFSRIEVISGELGKVGTKIEIFHKIGKRSISLLETVEENKLPEEYVTAFEANGGSGKSRYRFEELGTTKTKLTVECKHQSVGLVKVIGFFVPSIMEETARREMSKFKNFVEEASKNS